jgi:hypothetical protein
MANGREQDRKAKRLAARSNPLEPKPTTVPSRKSTRSTTTGTKPARSPTPPPRKARPQPKPRTTKVAEKNLAQHCTRMDILAAAAAASAAQNTETLEDSDSIAPGAQERGESVAEEGGAGDGELETWDEWAQNAAVDEHAELDFLSNGEHSEEETTQKKSST